QPGSNAVAQLMVLRPLVSGHHMLVEGPKDNEHVVTSFFQKADRALESVPLKGVIEVDPFKVRRCGAACSPGLVSRTGGAALGIILRLARNAEVNVRQRVSPGVGAPRRVG